MKGSIEGVRFYSTPLKPEDLSLMRREGGAPKLR